MRSGSSKYENLNGRAVRSVAIRTNVVPHGVNAAALTCMSSWVSTGPNPPITSDQIHQVLGSDQVKALAAKAGINPDTAGSAIAALLPTLVDKLTPNGSVPDHSNVLEMASSMLKNLQTPKAS